MKVPRLILLALLVSTVPGAAQIVLREEPARGTIKPGQTGYVTCGPGKARMITGGNTVQDKGPGRPACR